MKNRYASIPLNRASIDTEEVTAAVESLRSGSLCGGGPATRRVERQLAERLGVPHVMLTTSCTHALELALMALDVGPGDEVILPSFTFVSTANAVVRQAATPIFADIRPDTLTLDPDAVRGRLTTRTKAIITVHYAGIAGDLDALTALAEKQGVVLIEDAAQAFGSRHRGRPLGTVGRAGAFSFHETKNLTCGEGGALVTWDEDLARRAEVMREKGTNRAAFGRGEVDRYTWVDVGSSYVMADVLAAILAAQLQRFDALQAARSERALAYLSALAPLESAGYLRLPYVPSEISTNWHLFYIRLTTEIERDRCLQFLRSRGIQAAFHFVPLHTSPYARRLHAGAVPNLPVTDQVSRTLLRLPLYPQLTPEECTDVIDAVWEFFSGQSSVGTGYLAAEDPRLLER